MTRPFTAIALLLAALGWWAFNWPVLVSLHKRWWTFGETYEIGYPLLLIALYWIATQRRVLRLVPAHPSWVGGALFLSALLLSAAGRLAHVLVVQQLMVPLSLWCAVFALAGWAMASRLLLPFALLLGGVPVWDFLVEPLRALTVWAVQGLLGAIHIPALVQGYEVILTDGVMVIADACSGLNLLLAAVVIALLQASLNLHSPWRKALLIACSVLLGIIDNWLRVFGLILIAHYSEMKHPLVHDHVTFGWWLFVASLLPFFYVARIIERGDRLPVAGAAATGFTRGVPRGAWSFATAALALMMASAILLATLEHLQGRAPAPVHGFAAPAGAHPVGGGWLPSYSGYDLAQTWRVVDNGVAYDVAALTYANQTATRKLIYYANRIAEPDALRASGQLRQGGMVVLNDAVLRNDIGGDRIVWWLYRIDDANTTSVVTAKLLQLRAELFGDRAASFIALSRLCRASGCSAEREAASAAPERLLRLLPEHREL